MTSLAVAGSHCALSDHDRLYTELMAPSAVGIYLLKLLLVVVLLLAVVKFIGNILKFLMQLTAIVISINLAVIVYVASFLIVAGPIMVGQPLEHAIAWQKKAMQMMNSHLHGLY